MIYNSRCLTFKRKIKMIRVPGEHAPNVKNRSSKQYICMTKIKPIVRCVNNETLTKWANGGLAEARAELARRKAKREKKDTK